MPETKSKKSPTPEPKAAVPAKPYVVFARRFRPQTFADVAGQTAVTQALRQALTSGRLAQAYLLCGPRGVGKTSLARIFAKACNCLKGTGPNGVAEEPCNQCEACVSIQQGRSLDVIEMDAATNRGIEEVRSLRENVGISPAELRYKIYIIDEVHMLTREAWNAFLKTLEEPPQHVKFIFATTDPNDVPETILSRCQRFDLKRISQADIVKRLRRICEADALPFEEAALSRIAGLARGGLRDAEGLLDQAVNLGNGTISDAVIRELSGAAPDELIFDILKACAAGDTGLALTTCHTAIESGADPDDMLALLSERLRGTLLARVCGAASPLLEGQTHLQPSYAALQALLSDDQALMLIQLFTHARRQMRDASQTRLPLELALIRASRAKELTDLGTLAGALESMARRPSPASSVSGAARTAPPQQSAARQPPAREGPDPKWAGRPAGADARPQAAASIPSAAPLIAPPAQPQHTAQASALPRPLPPKIPASDEQTDDYIDAGALPLPETASLSDEDLSSAENSAAESEDDAPPALSRPPLPAALLLSSRASEKALESDPRQVLDKKLIEGHPLVQMLLKATGGIVLDVTRVRKRDGA